MSKFPKQVGSFERNVAHKVGKELLTHVMTHMTHEAMGGIHGYDAQGRGGRS